MSPSIGEHLKLSKFVCLSVVSDYRGSNSPVWMYVCFFMSDFWWNRLPQYWHGYGRVSLWISRWVDSVLERLNVLPHCLH